MLDTRALDFPHVLGIDALVLGDDGLAGFVGNVETRDFAAQPLGDEFPLGAFGTQSEIIEHEEVRQYLLDAHADGFEQYRDRHLATAVDAEEQNVFRVEFEIEPRAAVWNDER